jgi:DNA-binding beta-propeller fold protein YncE
MPLGLALNPAGTTLYMSDTQAQEVYSMPTATPSMPYTPTAISTVTFPTGLAVASNGTVYVASFMTDRVSTIPAAGGSPTVFATGFSSPYGLAFDANGNLFVSNEGSGSISRIPAGGGTPTTYVSGLDTPYFISFAPVPEPGAVMFACAAAGTCVAGWRRWRAHPSS